MAKTIPIMEIFGPTIQGEGLMAGTISHFLRTGGCPLRCEWCDTKFAVEPELVKKHGIRMTTDQIIAEVKVLPPAPYITFSGGDPCMHKDLGDIINVLNVNGMQIAVETQGTLFPDWLSKCDVITFSPKPPSSGWEVDPHPILRWLDEHANTPRSVRICIKIVVFNDADLEYATRLYGLIHPRYYDAFYFTAGTYEMRQTDNPIDVRFAGDQRRIRISSSMAELAEKIIDLQKEYDCFADKVHVGAQLHAMMWPTIERGK